MVLAQVKHQIASRDLHVYRCVLVEAMFPINREAEKVDVKLLGFLDREHPQNGNDAIEVDTHVRQGTRILRPYLTPCSLSHPETPGFRLEVLGVSGWLRLHGVRYGRRILVPWRTWVSTSIA